MFSRPAEKKHHTESPDRAVISDHGALVVLLGTLALVATAAGATADDPLTGLYGNTLISERTINISPLGGAAHVWLEKDGTYISFDATTGGRSGTYALKRVGASWQLCLNYPAPMGTRCYPIEPHKVGDTWISNDGDTFGVNSVVRGHQ
jgi:hypothetical protein